MAALRPYESREFRRVTGPTLRPGGFALTERALEVCELKTGMTVLDVGCGMGASVNRLSSGHGLKSLGVDASFSLLRDSPEQNPSVMLINGRAEALPFRDHAFDGVFCECVLSLLPDPLGALNEFCQVLKSGGRLVITDIYARLPEGALTLRPLGLNCCLKGIRSRGKMMEEIERAGLQLLFWEDHSRLLKHLAAQIVFAYGSMKAFWAVFAPECRTAVLDGAIAEAEPGYCLLVAQKC
ncbi:MAG: class I SAM-dependent methyltransferase [Deltaproteobacteria bacterium]|nr:class I SAM-dependent methyltransferase [Deltaproteobacteria bacterium]